MHTIAKMSLAGLFTLTLAGTSLAQDTYPDLKGTWVGKGTAIVLGAPKHHDKTAAKAPRLSDQNFTFKITDQKDGRFWGTMESARGKDLVIGILAPDKKRVLVAGEEGTAEGRLVDNNTFEWCYDHHTKDSIVVSCNTVRRQGS